MKRRYVETTRKRCALLVLEKEMNNNVMGCKVRNYFQSVNFTKTFGKISWGKKLSIEWPFVQDVFNNRKLHTEGQVAFNTKSNNLEQKHMSKNNAKGVAVFLSIFLISDKRS